MAVSRLGDPLTRCIYPWVSGSALFRFGYPPLSSRVFHACGLRRTPDRLSGSNALAKLVALCLLRVWRCLRPPDNLAVSDCFLAEIEGLRGFESSFTLHPSHTLSPTRQVECPIRRSEE